MRHLPKIEIEVIPQKSQRYDTVGDYFVDGDTWKFKISEMNSKEEICCLVHELIEWYLTQERGIKEEEISKFDIESGLEDPGLSPEAPYHKEHMFSDAIERLLAHEVGLDWPQYDKDVDNLFN